MDGGFAFGDIDGDGDLDLMGFTAGDPNRQIALYRNDLPAQHWLNVRPVGLPGNRSGVNSKIRIYEANSDHLLWFEEVLAFSKQAQQNYYALRRARAPLRPGSRATVDVTVTFYPSGTVVRKNGVAADSTVVINEDGSSGTVQPPSLPMAFDAGFLEGGSSGSGTSPGGSGSSRAGSGASRGGSGSSPAGSGPDASSSKSGGCSCRAGAGGGRDRERRAIELLFTLLVLFSMHRRLARSARR